MLAFEMGNNWQTYVFFSVCGAILLFLIGYEVYYRIDKAKRNREIQESWDKFEEPPITEYHVTVFDMACDAESYGYAQPALEKSFHVVFLTDDGEKLELEVDEETYLSLSKGESGMLAVLNEKFYGFNSD